MKKGHLSEYFTGVAAKRLSDVETHLKYSNQHEFNGVEQLKKLLGTERLTNIPTRFLWLGEEDQGFSEDSFVTWYDARERHPTRSEYRLYFRSNSVMDHANAGDLLIVAKRASGELMIIVVASYSTVENQLIWIFDLSELERFSDLSVREGEQGTLFTYQDIEGIGNHRVDFAGRYILEELDIEIEEPEPERLDVILEPLKGIFPSTAEFSRFARKTISGIDPLMDPDGALLAWMEHEEKLFRRLERREVSVRLDQGFSNNNVMDVEGFIKYSLSIQNRRKSRAGLALEHHLAEIFSIYNLKFKRQVVTEHKSKPDFLFPGLNEYHDSNFPVARLSMLGAKSTCKDRWRQVLSEAARIPEKHLLTLEPGISENQTNEMQANNLQLVLPKALHVTYNTRQKNWLMDINDFVCRVIKQQQN